MQTQELNGRAGGDQQWFVVYTKHQHESAVATLLGAKGLDVFYPTYVSLRRWKDRRKAVTLPLFPGYVFFAGLKRRAEILATPGVFTILTFGDTPAQIPSEEVEAIRCAVRSSLPVQPCPYLTIGDTVTVMSGPLAGVTGILQKLKGSCRLVISVELLGRSAAVEIDASTVRQKTNFRSQLGQSKWTEQPLHPLS